MTKTNSIFEAPRAPAQLPLGVPWALLGQRSPTVFMRDYWHKRPLLVRQAIPSFALAKAQGEGLQSPISAQALFGFACDGHSEVRLVKAKPWQLQHGPFNKKQIPSLQKRDWTLLIQGVEARHPAAANVLSWFRFIPDARLDDLMISIAGIGGGVGPHVDSYDVFLIQMEGRRHWKISSQADLSLREDLPLKILSRFKPEEDWVLEPGDLLYLPPNIAHEGIALDSGCQTWSVGFRSPTFKELIQEGLWRLAESLDDDPKLNSIYADPKQEATHYPGVLPKQLVNQLEQRLNTLALAKSKNYLQGIAAYLSEPKPHAIFDGPQNPLSPGVFWQTLTSKVLVPHPQTRLLAWEDMVFCNGQTVSEGQKKETCAAWHELVKEHRLALGRGLNKKLSRIKDLKRFTQVSVKNNAHSAKTKAFLTNNSLYEAYRSGWLIFDSSP